MIVVQHVELTWTKQSRGGDAARVRESFPESFPLPDFQPSNQTWVVHRVRSSEWNGFHPEQSLRMEPPSFGQWQHFGGVQCQPSETELLIQLTSRVPDGNWFTPKRLTANEWLRVIAAERQTDFDTGTWYYIKHVVTFGFLEIARRTEMPKNVPEVRHVRIPW